MPDQTQQGFPNGVDLRGGTIWTKWSKTARKFQNWHFWVKTVGRGGGGGEGGTNQFFRWWERGDPPPAPLPSTRGNPAQSQTCGFYRITKATMIHHLK